MLGRIFGKPKQETNALTTLDKLNEVYDLRFMVLILRILMFMENFSVSGTKR